MDDIQRYADLLTLLDAPSDGPGTNDAEPVLSSSSEDDDEAEEWAALLLRASPALMRKTRLQLCAAGLKAVHHYITTHPYAH